VLIFPHMYNMHLMLLPLFGNNCQDIVLGSMTGLDFRDTHEYLFPNKGSILQNKEVGLYM
jgi:hypothetical protein